MTKISVIPTGSKDQLFSLIKSLSKAEKRNFKLYANRTGAQKDQKFIRLFDVVDKMSTYDEEQVRIKMGRLTKGKLSNLKRHLYRQILISLRLIYKDKDNSIEIREQIDFAWILYSKGLYLQALKLLDRIRGQALENNHDLLYLEILEFQKMIEERHITRSRQVKGKVEALMLEAAKYSNITQNRCRLSNLKIQMHGYYIQHGHIQKEEDVKFLDYYLKSSLQDIKTENLSFFEKVYLHQAYVWYYYILLDFKKCLRHARDWVRIFDKHLHMITLDKDLYMRGLHYTLTSAFHIKDKETFLEYLKEFEEFYSEQKKSFSPVSKALAFVYLNTARINKHYYFGTFEGGLKLVPKLLSEMRGLEHSLDVHRIMVFNYKIAYLYFGSGKPEETLDYLNQIIQLKAGHLRADIQSYSRILSILAHYQLGHYDLIPYLADQTMSFIKKIGGSHETQTLTVKFFKSLVNIPPTERKKAFEKFKKTLLKLEKNRLEKRSFVYLDILTWVESQLQDKTMQAIIKKASA
ncbi:MAG: hypothetical protein HKN16_07865 [Saprospiraceae bacterium]|nr:hypothetical protein [Saprospiraceae bacterium]